MNRGHPSLQRLYRISYWIIPVVLLFFVFRRIDFRSLVSIFRRSNPWLVVLGVAYYPLVVMIGAWRWRILLTRYVGRIPTQFVVKHYWIGLGLGYFAPGSLGWDAYRVAAAGRRYGQYTMNIAVIVVEKLAALVCCTAIIIALSPSVPVSGRADLTKVLHWVYALIAVLMAAAIAVALAWRHRPLIERIETGFAALLNKLFSRFNPGGTAASSALWPRTAPAISGPELPKASSCASPASRSPRSIFGLPRTRLRSAA